MNITYVVGDATRPIGDGPRVIAHICNDQGGWGRGFVVALSKRDPFPEQCYRGWHRYGSYLDPDFGPRPFALGQTQIVSMKDFPVFAANMVAQHQVRHDLTAPPAVQYGALRSCLNQLADFCVKHVPEDSVASVHMPRIGCGLGGGSWDRVEPIIQETLIARGVPVTVYDLKNN